MAYRTLEISQISAKDLKDVSIFSKTEVYAVLSLSGDKQSRQRTPTDRVGGRNPSWTSTLRFSVPAEGIDPSRLVLQVLLRGERALGDRDIGEVHVPISELLSHGAPSAPSAPRFVSYQVRSPSSGKPKGVLSFSYKLGEPTASAAAAPRPSPATAQSYPPPYSYPPPSAASKLNAPIAAYPPPSAGSKLDAPVAAYPAAASAAAHPYPPPSSYPPPATGKPPKGTEPVTAYPAASSSAAAPYPPPYGYPPPPQQSGYGYPPPPPQQSGYGYPPPPPQQYGYGYPPPPAAAYGYGAPPPMAVKPQKNKNNFGLGLGAGILGGALGGLLIGEAVDDVYDAGYDNGFDNGYDDGGFGF